MTETQSVYRVDGATFRQRAVEARKEFEANVEAARKQVDEERREAIAAVLKRANVTPLRFERDKACLGDGAFVFFDDDHELVVEIACEQCGAKFSRRVWQPGELIRQAGEAYAEAERHIANGHLDQVPEEDDPSITGYEELEAAASIFANNNGNEAAYLQGIGHALIALVEELRLHRS